LSISNFHVVGVVRVRDKCEKKNPWKTSPTVVVCVETVRRHHAGMLSTRLILTPGIVSYTIHHRQ
jgi:hypothetical protein